MAAKGFHDAFDSVLSRATINFALAIGFSETFTR
jgi:hypothetical protein